MIILLGFVSCSNHERSVWCTDRNRGGIVVSEMKNLTLTGSNSSFTTSSTTETAITAASIRNMREKKINIRSEPNVQFFQSLLSLIFEALTLFLSLSLFPCNDFIKSRFDHKKLHRCPYHKADGHNSLQSMAEDDHDGNTETPQIRVALR